MLDLSNREISVIILFIILLFFVALKDRNNFFKSLWDVLKSFWNIKILLPIILLAGYSLAVILIISEFFNITDISIKNIIAWFIFTAIVLMFSLTNISKELNFFKNIVLKNLVLLAFVEYVFNFYSFSLIIELFLQFGITVFALLVLVASVDEKHKKVQKIFNIFLSLLVLVVFVKSVQGIFNDFGGQFMREFLLNFIIPVVLTISIMPFLYFMAIVMQYELLFIRLPYILNLTKDEKIKFIIKRRIFLKYGLNLKKIISATNKELNFINNKQ
jgi:hypothetical protein